MKRLLQLFPAFLGFMLLASSCVVQQNPVSGNKRAFAYSWEQELQLGEEADGQIIAQYGLYDDDAVPRYVEDLGQELLEVSHMRRDDTPEQFRETEFTFRVLNSPVVNAFALPGGYVYVTRGLMNHLNNEAQLAVVLGHEIGHVAARHASQRGVQQAVGQVAVLGGAILGQELLGLPGQDLLNLGGTAAQFLTLRYGRDHERESDRLGVEYSAMKGYVAAEGAAFFTSLKRISEQSGQSIPSLLSTHPDPGEREQNIPRMAAEWEEQGYEQTERNGERYMQHVDGMVYGENPREGFVDGGRFVHPELEFAYPVPENWRVINQPSQVVFLSPDEDAVVMLQIDSEASSARESVDTFTSQEGMTVEQQGSTSENNLDAFQAEAVFDDGEQTLGLLVYALEYSGNIYRFVNYTLRDRYSSYEDDFRRVTSGFDRLRDNRLLNIQPVRMNVITTSRNSRFRDLLPSPLPMDIEPGDIAILNQVHLDDMIQAGTQIKLPVQ